MPRSFRIKHCNCLEYVLSNIILNENLNNSLLFINSWNFKYEKEKEELWQRFSVYSNDFSDLFDTAKKFCGVQVIKTFDIMQVNKYEMLVNLMDKYKYVAIKIKARECPWLAFLDDFQGMHMILILSCREKGILCSDVAKDSFELSFEFLRKKEVEFVVFDVIKNDYEIKDIQSKMANDINIKAKKMDIFDSIKLFANEFNDICNIDKEFRTGSIIASPLVKQLSLVGFSRLNYTQAIRFAFETELIIAKIENLLCGMENISLKWLYINKNLSKYIVTHDKILLEQIKLILFDISEKEYSIASVLNDNLIYYLSDNNTENC